MSDDVMTRPAALKPGTPEWEKAMAEKLAEIGRQMDDEKPGDPKAQTVLLCAGLLAGMSMAMQQKGWDRQTYAIWAGSRREWWGSRGMGTVVSASSAHLDYTTEDIRELHANGHLGLDGSFPVPAWFVKEARHG